MKHGASDQTDQDKSVKALLNNYNNGWPITFGSCSFHHIIIGISSNCAQLSTTNTSCSRTT
jgi:hypothetical protein